LPRKKRPYKKRQPKDPNAQYHNADQKQILSSNALANMKSHPPARKTDGWRWDELGNRIKTNPRISNTVKKPTLNNSLTVKKA
jgi:hypothetical protein